MFVTRLISGIILLIVTIILVVTGGDVLFLALALISLIGMSELYKIVKVEKSLIGIAGYAVILLYYGAMRLYPEYMLESLLIGMMIIMAVYVFTFPAYKADQTMLVYFGIMYVGVMLSCVYRTRMLADGAYLVWLIFLCSWGSDTCAYAVGMLFGKHKLAPRLSPKKSIEGAIGGIAGATLLAVLYAYGIERAGGVEENRMLMYAVICGAGAVISQIGDLAASAIKRNHDIKDYGRLIPGHGGILDRFDSIIFTAPMIYFLSVVLIG